MASSAVLDGQDPSGEAPDLPELKAEGVRLRSELAAARESESRLREQLARSIETQQRMLARLAGGMAHDFNNLLTIIAGYAMLLHEDDATPAPARERLSEILRASNCAKDLTHKLLVLSRKQPARPRVIEVDRFLRTQAIKPLEELAGPAVTMAIQLSARDITIRIDPAELIQMLSTLVLNARDAMPAGGTLTIASTVEEHVSGPTSRSRKAGAHVRVSVSDTGAGMDDAVQAQLFEPFFTTKRLGTGSGLGLAMLKGLVEQSGGFVDVHSSPSLGTTMTLWFPVATQPEAEDQTIATATVARGGTETVLVVDDDAAVRELTRAILTRFGYQVTDVSHPHAALRLAREGQRFDLIVSDVVMPGMDGSEMIRELTAIAPGFEFLYISGFADASNADAALQCDAAHFLGKPFTPTALATKVRELLDAR